MKKNLVSIVTPCYNGEYFIRRFLKSILNQTYSNIEMILINDGSTDRTEEIVREFQNEFSKRGIRFVYQYQENSGQAAALNNGLKLFEGEFLIWPDSDDELMPRFIEEKVNFLRNHPEFEYCYGKSIIVDENEPEKIIKINRKRNSNEKYHFFKSILYFKNVFFQGYMVKTSALEAVIPNREIYTGRGGQNAQILLPFGWFYGEPGYVEKSVYKCYVRNESHSHSQNTSEKIIQQLYNYENILINTMKNIPDEKVLRYISEIHVYYTKLRFGNAVDTKNVELIKEQYKELSKSGERTLHDFLLFIKYTNRVIRKILHIEG